MVEATGAPPLSVDPRMNPGEAMLLLLLLGPIHRHSDSLFMDPIVSDRSKEVNPLDRNFLL